MIAEKGLPLLPSPTISEEMQKVETVRREVGVAGSNAGRVISVQKPSQQPVPRPAQQPAQQPAPQSAQPQSAKPQQVQPQQHCGDVKTERWLCPSYKDRKTADESYFAR